MGTDIIEGFKTAAYRRKFFTEALWDYSKAPKDVFFVDDVWIR